jgi:hypothetical protein
MRRLAVIVVVFLLIGTLCAAGWLYTPDRPRAVLEAKYAGPPSQFLEIAGLRLHVRDSGPKGALGPEPE